MANHHSDDRGMPEELRQAMFERPLIGATGTFPDGSLNQADEGAIQFRIGEKDGNVIVDFGTPVVWLGMTPQQAVTMAEAIIAKARVVARRKGETLTVSL